MICKKCGHKIEENQKFCANCGAEIDFNSTDVIPENLRPLSPWAYFGLQILFSIPIVGFIFLIIFSCKKSNINRRNFARSYWCSLILVAVILVIYLLVFINVFQSINI
ncbi:MAG: zinc-ribbon domain-containing protein [Clostridia bacterium]|nr:zinc-ribbon domain-containing protein [Clostridia bacterium]